MTQSWCPLPKGVDCKASPSHLGKGPPYFFNLSGCHAPIVLAVHLLPLIRVPWLTQMPVELAHPTGLSYTHLNLQGFSLGWGTISGSFLNSLSLVSQAVNDLPAAQKSWVRSLGWEDSPREGNGNAVQYSCLGNPLDRGAWQAAVHGVAKTDTTE